MWRAKLVEKFSNLKNTFFLFTLKQELYLKHFDLEFMKPIFREHQSCDAKDGISTWQLDRKPKKVNARLRR